MWELPEKLWEPNQMWEPNHMWELPEKLWGRLWGLLSWYCLETFGYQIDSAKNGLDGTFRLWHPAIGRKGKTLTGVVLVIASSLNYYHLTLFLFHLLFQFETGSHVTQTGLELPMELRMIFLLDYRGHHFALLGASLFSVKEGCWNRKNTGFRVTKNLSPLHISRGQVYHLVQESSEGFNKSK